MCFQIYFLGIAILDGLIINLFIMLIYISVFLRVRTHVLIRRPNELALRLATSAFLISACYLFLGKCTDNKNTVEMNFRNLLSFICSYPGFRSLDVQVYLVHRQRYPVFYKCPNFTSIEQTY